MVSRMVAANNSLKGSRFRSNQKSIQANLQSMIGFSKQQSPYKREVIGSTPIGAVRPHSSSGRALKSQSVVLNGFSKTNLIDSPSGRAQSFKDWDVGSNPTSPTRPFSFFNRVEFSSKINDSV